MNSIQYDYIFAGFGLSGMSLLYEMSKYDHFKSKKVLVIDSDDKNTNDRTWSFWATNLYGLESIVRKSWKEGYSYDSKGNRIGLQLKDYAYYTIRGIDFYNFIKNQLAPFSNITFIQDHIQSVQDTGKVIGEKTVYQGKKVSADMYVHHYIRYFKREEIPRNLGESFVWQHFKGWFIKTKTPQFNPNEFLIMDYRDASEDRTNFFYVLPYSETEALVEFTEFSKEFYTQDEYDILNRDYLEKYWQITDYEIKEMEFNAIPMTNHIFKNTVKENVITIGTLGGYVKASSGYCFTRTIEKNIALASVIMSQKTVSKQVLESHFRFNLYDSAMLSLLASGKLLGKQVFPSMFRIIKGDHVFRFLDEKTNFLQEIQVMLTVPKKWRFIMYYVNRVFSW